MRMGSENDIKAELKQKGNCYLELWGKALWSLSDLHNHPINSENDVY